MVPRASKKKETLRKVTSSKPKNKVVEKMENIEREKKLKILKEGEKKIPLSYAAIVLIAIALIGAVFIFSPEKPFLHSNARVKDGDVVQVQYTGMYENGSVFDSGNYTFKVGSGQVIPGFENAIKGMRAGETKTVKLSPDEAYGEYNENMVFLIPLLNKRERKENVTKNVFVSIFGEDPVMGKLYTIENMDWPLKVVGINNDTIVLEHEPKNNTVVERDYGNDTIIVEGDKLIIKTEPKVGSSINTLFGVGKIIWANETHMKIDFNPPLAGKTLIFKVKILNVIPS